MTSALLDSPPPLFAGAGVGARPVGRGSGGRSITLEERLQLVWRSALRDGSADCPVCRAPMRAEGAAARCEGCGSVVS